MQLSWVLIAVLSPTETLPGSAPGVVLIFGFFGAIILGTVAWKRCDDSHFHFNLTVVAAILCVFFILMMFYSNWIEPEEHIGWRGMAYLNLFLKMLFGGFGSFLVLIASRVGMWRIWLIKRWNFVSTKQFEQDRVEE